MGGLPWWSSVLDFASIAGARDWGTQIPRAVVWPKKKEVFCVSFDLVYSDFWYALYFCYCQMYPPFP